MSVTVAELGERALRRLGVVTVPEADRPAENAPTTYSALASAALQELGVIAADESPDTNDQTLATLKVIAVHNNLVGAGIVAWEIDQIPQAVAEEYTKLTAAQLATSYGKASSLDAVAALEARIRRYAAVRYAPQMATQAVLDVHMELAATGLASWSSQDIPPGAEEPYTTLAAVALAPTYERQLDPRLGLMARQQLRRIVSLPSGGMPVRAEYF